MKIRNILVFLLLSTMAISCQSKQDKVKKILEGNVAGVLQKIMNS